jgi:polyferredoxin
MAIQPFRQNVGRLLAAIFFILPYIKIGGESAFRFDVPTLRFHVFGVELWMQDFILVLLATGFSMALFLLMTFVYGRVWCGWFCSQTVFNDLTDFMSDLPKKSVAAKAGAHLLLLALSFLTGFTFVCYVVSPYEALPAMFSGNLGPVVTGTTIVMGIITYLNFAFIRRTFCATICPYGKIQGALLDEKSMIIQQDPERLDECIDCKLCVRVCPTELDIRKGMQVGCIMCARCVDACAKVMGKKQKKSLVNYSFGIKDVKNQTELIRPVSVALALVCVFTLSLFIYKTATRSSFDFSLLPHPMEARVTKEGDVMNAYVISIKNKRQEELALAFSMQPEEGVNVAFRHNIQEKLWVPAGRVDKYPLFVRTNGSPGKDITLHITLTADGELPESRVKSVYFNLP